MKAKVIVAYLDGKDSNKNHKVNEIVDLTEERFNELEKMGFVKAEVVDQSVEVEKLNKEINKLKSENKELTAKVKELETTLASAVNKDRIALDASLPNTDNKSNGKK